MKINNTMLGQNRELESKIKLHTTQKERNRDENLGQNRGDFVCVLMVARLLHHGGMLLKLKRYER